VRLRKVFAKREAFTSRGEGRHSTNMTAGEVLRKRRLKEGPSRVDRVLRHWGNDDDLVGKERTPVEIEFLRSSSPWRTLGRRMTIAKKSWVVTYRKSESFA